MTQVIIGDLRTGRKIVTVPHSAMSWNQRRNTAEVIRCTMPLSSRLVRKLDLRNATTPAKSFIAILEGDYVMAAGPIWRRQYSKASRSLELTGAGIWSYFDHRVVMGLLAEGENVIDPVTGESVESSNTSLEGLSYGTMAKRLIQQSMEWVGGDIPINFLPDEAASFSKNWKGQNLSQLGESLRNFTSRADGIDIAFPASLTGDRMGIEWLLRTGTVDNPELHGNTVHVWDYRVKTPSIRNLVEIDDAADMAGQVWAQGGRQDGTVVIERAVNDGLVDAGYPLLELVDSSHSDASEVDTLLNYAENHLHLGSAPESAWSFEVRADRPPYVGQYGIGDYVDLKIRDDPWFPAGTYRREIAALSGDHNGKWVKVTAEAVVGMDGFTPEISAPTYERAMYPSWHTLPDEDEFSGGL